MWEKMVVSWWRAASWLLLLGESGDAGDGLVSTWMRSRVVAVAASAEDAVGMVTLDGSHTSGSAMHLAVVSHIHTW
jgi:hypothetical protein